MGWPYCENEYERMMQRVFLGNPGERGNPEDQG
jgi:hypothetical protein